MTIRPQYHAGRGCVQRGLTLIELLIVMLIGGLLIIAAVVNLRSLDAVNTRTAARFMSSTLRFAYDRARATGRDHRLVLDLDAEGGTSITLEVATKGKQLMPRDLDEAWKQHDAFASGEEEEQALRDMETTTIGGLSKDLLALPRPTGPQWQKVELRTGRANDQLKKSARLVKSIYLERLEEEISEGKVILHIWGGGRLERAAIYIADRKDRTYTLVTYPLTGRVKIHNERYELPSSLLNADDLGEEVQER